MDDLKFELLLTTIHRRYEVDLAGYGQKSLRRRVLDFIKNNDISDVAELVPKVLNDRAFFVRLLSDMVVSVTEMFRDPSVFLALRTSILPRLKQLPYLKIWHAGCATGEEVYSLAIILHELDMLETATIYGTDICIPVLDKAKQGIYSNKDKARWEQNYISSGGRGNFSDYYLERYEHFRFHRFLRTNITFAEHDLVRKAPFGEVNLILCRNVLIYFDRPLQNQVAQTFAESLVDGGILVLGSNETLNFLDAKSHFSCLSSTTKIYEKLATTSSSHGQIYGT